MTDFRALIDEDDPGWLPPLVSLSACGGDYFAWMGVLLRVYQRDFVQSVPTWRGYRVATQRYPEIDGKPNLFCHLTDAADRAGTRLPDTGRSERIAWIRAVLTAPEADVRAWLQTRQDKQISIGIAIPNFSYVVFVRPWPDRVQLMTAYYVANDSKRLDYAEQWDRGRTFDLVALNAARSATVQGPP